MRSARGEPAGNPADAPPSAGRILGRRRCGATVRRTSIRDPALSPRLGLGMLHGERVQLRVRGPVGNVFPSARVRLLAGTFPEDLRNSPGLLVSHPLVQNAVAMKSNHTFLILL